LTKKKKHVQVATEPTQEKSEPVAAEVIKPEPAQPKPELPLTLEQRLEKIESYMEISDKNFQQIGDYINRVDVALQKIAAIPQQQSQGGGPDVMSMAKTVTDLLKNDVGSNPLQDKMNTFMGAVLDKAIQSVTNPQKPLIEQYLEQEVAKKTAKALAESTA